MKSGIYKIVNNITKDFYLGSSQNLYTRKGSHFRMLKNNVHYNKHFQNAVNLYGIENFEFIILCKCPKEYLLKLEQWFLDNLKPKYNKSSKAIATYGYKHSIEIKNKKSKQKKIPVLQIDLITEKVIKRFDSALDASIELNIIDRAINACCRKKIPSAYGYYWQYETELGINIPKVKRNQRKNTSLIKEAKRLYKLGNSVLEISKLTKLSYMNVYYHCKQNRSR